MARHHRAQADAEEALLESEERYRSLINLGGAVGEAIVMLQDTEQGDAIQTFVSKEWPRITGYSKKELLGMSFFDLLHPRYHEAALKRHKRRMRGESIPKLLELSIIRKDGAEVPIEITSAYSTYKGEPANVAFIRDITERKQAEETLEGMERRYHAIFEQAADSIVLVDAETGALTEFNERACQNLGYSHEEFEKLKISDFEVIESAGEVTKHIKKIAKEGYDLFETQHRTKSGEILDIEVNSRAICLEGRNFIQSIWRDITERKQAEERESRLQQELYLSSRLAAIGELAAGVAHEINNPLTGIMGYSERLLRKPADENTRKGLEIIHSSSLRVSKIVQNLLTFARRHQPKREYVDINEIVKEALELRIYELTTGNIEAALVLASNLPQIMGDFHQLQEVFLNLILNAEQAMREAHGRGKLIIKTKQLKNRVRVSFADDGSGIPTEHLDKLFDPFFSTREEKGGTGLGLSICHGIVEEHRGKIYAKSELGKGTTFFVELPIVT